MSDTHTCVYWPSGDDKRCYVNGCRYHDGFTSCTVDGIVPNKTPSFETNPWSRPMPVDVGGRK